MNIKQQNSIKSVVFIAALFPVFRLIFAVFTDNLGANPIEFITRNTGDWTLYFLCITLSVTPVRRMMQWPWLLKWRRMLGLYVFFYALLHFITFLWFDHFFDIDEMLKDIIKRPFILVGFSAFILLIPLVLTSTNKMIKRLGGKRWQWLHRLVYVIAPLGILHYVWMKAGKHNFTQPVIWGSIVAVLLLLRIVWAVQKNRAGKMAAG